jgi:transposase InsO family protein
MNVHKNARSCPASRELLVRRVLKSGWSLRRAAAAVGLSDRRGREWLRRGERHEPLIDRSSRPRTTRQIDEQVRAKIAELRRERMTMRRIAQHVHVSLSTVGRVCRAAGLSRLNRIDPPPPPRRYEKDRPGELLHIDVKKLGRFDAVGHRITRTRSHGGPRQGWEFVHVATDDNSRVSYAEILPDERRHTASAFLTRAVRWFARYGVQVESVMTDNGSAYVSFDFRDTCRALDLHHVRIRPYTPKTNGKVERMIQTLLREWAYRFAYNSSEERKRWLDDYLHFYNFHRAHSSLAYNAPISRLVRNNLMARNS